MMNIVDGPTIGYDLVDAAIRQRNENLLFNSGIRPEDERLKLKTGIFGDIGYYGTETAKDAISFYNSYSSITSYVHSAIEGALGIVFDLYQAFLKFKSLNPTKYDEVIKSFKEHDSKTNPWRLFDKELAVSVTEENKADMSAFDTFKTFCDAFASAAPNADISFAMVRDSYIDTVAKLRTAFAEFELDGLILDIENASEYPQLKASACPNNIVFKVRPSLKTIVKSQANDVIPICDYKVLLDFNSLVMFIINNWGLTVPDELPAGQKVAGENDKTAYVTQQLVNASNLAELMTKRIELELLDAAHNVHANYCHFVKKFINILSKNRAAPLVFGVNNKLNYLLKEQSQTDDEISIDVLITKIYDYISVNPVENVPFLIQLKNASLDDSAYFENMTAVLFRKSFAHYFEDAVLTVPFKDDGKWIVDCYSREFDRPYDKTELITHVDGIDDYNTKDFFRHIINDYNKAPLITYDKRKLANGENVGFMYDKLKRNYILNVAALFAIATDFQQKDSRIKYDFDNKLQNEIKRDVNNFERMVLRLVKSIVSESGVIIHDTWIPGLYAMANFRKMREYCMDYTGHRITYTKNGFLDIYDSYVKSNVLPLKSSPITPRDLLGKIFSFDSIDLATKVDEAKAVTSTGEAMFNSIIRDMEASGKLMYQTDDEY